MDNVSLWVIILIVGFVIYLARGGWNKTEQLEDAVFARREIFVRTYKGSQLVANGLFQADAPRMAARDYFPSTQSWVPGEWSTGAFIFAVLLIFLFGLGLLILGYMLIVKPDGTLSVNYRLGATSYAGFWVTRFDQAAW